MNKPANQPNHLDEFKEFEEKLSKLKQMLSEEVQRMEQLRTGSTQTVPTTSTPTTTTISPLMTAPVTLSPFHHNQDYLRRRTTIEPYVKGNEQPLSSLLGGHTQKPWYKNKSTVGATVDDVEATLEEVVKIVDPTSMVFNLMNWTLLAPVRRLSAATQQILPKPLRSSSMEPHISQDLTNIIEKLVRLVVHDLPQIALKMPTTLQRLSQSLDQLRVNGTETLRNTDERDVLSRVRSNLVAWSIIFTQTAIMSPVAIDMATRAGWRMLKVIYIAQNDRSLETVRDASSRYFKAAFHQCKI